MAGNTLALSVSDTTSEHETARRKKWLWIIFGIIIGIVIITAIVVPVTIVLTKKNDNSTTTAATATTEIMKPTMVVTTGEISTAKSSV